MHPHAELAKQMMSDLRLTLPKDLIWDVSEDVNTAEVILYLRRNQLWSGCSLADDLSRCELAYFVVDHIQDFMADVYSVWWPQIGEQRLDFEIDCVEDRPKLMFTLRLD